MAELLSAEQSRITLSTGGHNGMMLRFAGCIALVAALMVSVDPIWCADGCTDDTAAIQATDASACAVCQRSVPTPTDVTPPTHAVSITVAGVTMNAVLAPDAWFPGVDRPPRRA